jgi:cell division protein FtsB
MARSARDAQPDSRSQAASPALWLAVISWFNRLLAGGVRGVAVLAAASSVAVLIGLMAINFIGQIMQGARLDAERNVLQSEIEELRRQNQLLQAEVDYTASDAYVERQIREYGYARDGDVVLIAERIDVPAAELPAPPPPEQIPVLTENRPNWLRWWTAVFP